MQNIVKDIEQNCKDKSIKGIVKFLHASRDIPHTADAYREIWFFYQEAIKKSEQKSYYRKCAEARRLTKEVMNINETKFKRIKSRYQDRSIE